MRTSIEKRHLLGALVCALLGAAGCGPGGRYVWVAQRPPEPVSASARTVIAPGDVLAVQVYGDETMSTEGRVLGDGTLTVPVLGPVQVAGKRPEELAASLEQQLVRYIQAPKVTVMIKESVVSVAVLGEVNAPGVVDLAAPASVLEALAKAGGITEFADSSSIFVLRNRAKDVERIRFTYSALVQGEPAAAGFRLKTDDTVVVE
jgi:polysaccharide export outer membrane protein